MAHELPSKLRHIDQQPASAPDAVRIFLARGGLLSVQDLRRIIRTLVERGVWSALRTLIDEVARHGSINESTVHYIAVTELERASSMRRVFWLFPGLLESIGCDVDVTTLETVLAAYCRERAPDELLGHLKYILAKTSIAPEAARARCRLYTRVQKELLSLRAFGRFEQVLAAALTSGPSPETVYTWTYALLSESKDFERIMRTYRKMRGQGLEVQAEQVSHLLPAFLKGASSLEDTGDKDDLVLRAWKVWSGFAKNRHAEKKWFPDFCRQHLTSGLLRALSALFVARQRWSDLANLFHAAEENPRISEEETTNTLGGALVSAPPVPELAVAFAAVANRVSVLDKKRALWDRAITANASWRAASAVDRAWQSLESMRQHELAPGQTAYCALLERLLHADQSNRAVELYATLRHLRALPTESSCSMLVSAAARSRPELAIVLFEEMLQHEMRPNLAAHNGAVFALATMDRSEDAWTIRTQMSERGQYVAAGASAKLLYCLVKNRQFNRAKEHYEGVLRTLRNFRVHPGTGSRLAAGLAGSGRAEDAVRLFRDLEAVHGPYAERDTSFLISALCSAGRPDVAYELFESLGTRDLRPDGKALTAMVKALGEAGLSERLWELLKPLLPPGDGESRASDKGSWNDRQFWNTAILAAGRTRDCELLAATERAFRVWHRPDDFFFNNLIDARFRCQNAEEGMSAFVEMIRSGMEPDVFTEAILVRNREVDSIEAAAAAVREVDGAIDGPAGDLLVRCLARCNHAEQAWDLAIQRAGGLRTLRDETVDALLVGLTNAGDVARSAQVAVTVFESQTCGAELLAVLVRIFARSGDVVRVWAAYSALTREGRQQRGVKGSVTLSFNNDLHDGPTSVLVGMLRETEDADLVDFMSVLFATFYEFSTELVEVAIDRLADSDTKVETARGFAKMLGRACATAYFEGECGGLSLDEIVCRVHSALGKRNEYEARHLCMHFLVGESGAVRRLLTRRYVEGIQRILLPLARASTHEARELLRSDQSLLDIRRLLATRLPGEVLPEHYSGYDCMDLAPELDRFAGEVHENEHVDEYMGTLDSHVELGDVGTPVLECNGRSLMGGSVWWRRVQVVLYKIVRRNVAALLDTDGPGDEMLWDWRIEVEEPGLDLVLQLRDRRVDPDTAYRDLERATNFLPQAPPPTIRVESESDPLRVRLAIKRPFVPERDSVLEHFFSFLKQSAEAFHQRSQPRVSMYAEANRLFRPEGPYRDLEPEDLRGWLLQRLDDLLDVEVNSNLFPPADRGGWAGALRTIGHKLARSIERTHTRLNLAVPVRDGEVQEVVRGIGQLYKKIGLLTRAQRDEEMIGETSLTAEIARCVRRYQQRYPNQALFEVVSPDKDVYSFLQPVLLRQALEDALHNAVKAVSVENLEEEPLVRVRLDADEAAGKARITIENPFDTGQAEAKRGVGAGLAIIREQVERMGGEVEVRAPAAPAAQTWRLAILLPLLGVDETSEDGWSGDDTVRNIWRVLRVARRQADWRRTQQIIELGLSVAENRSMRARLYIERAREGLGRAARMSRGKQRATPEAQVLDDLREAVRLARELGDRMLYQRALGEQIAALVIGSAGEAIDLLEEEQREHPELFEEIESVNFLRRLADLEHNRGRTDRALAYERQRRTMLAEMDFDRTEEIMRCENSMYKLCRALSLLDQALALCESRLRMARELEDGSAEVQVLNEFGAIYREMSKPDRAIEYLSRAHHAAERLLEHAADNDRIRLSSNLVAVKNTLAMAYLDANQVPAAIQEIEKAETLCRRHLDQGRRAAQQLAVVLCTRGEIYRLAGQPDLAVRPLEGALEAGANPKTQLIASARLALVQAVLGNRQGAMSTADQAVRLIDQLVAEKDKIEYGLLVARAMATAGEFGRAIRLAEESLARAERMNDRRLLREAAETLESVLRDGGREDDADYMARRMATRGDN